MKVFVVNIYKLVNNLETNSIAHSCNIIFVLKLSYEIRF